MLEQAQLHQLQQQLQQTTLCIVSKNQPIEHIQYYYDLGYRIFAENRYPQLQEKYQALPKDIQWHFIGHLQTNKIKHVIPYITTLQSLDSLHLAKQLQAYLQKQQRTLEVYLQVHLALQDQHKTGFLEAEVQDAYQQIKQQCSNLDVSGLMVMGPHTQDTDQIEHVFQQAQKLTQTLNLSKLSMGMSDDYPIALKYGSTMVRLGSKLFQ